MPNVLRHLQDLEHAYPTAIASAAASLAFAGFENGFANVEANRTIARVSRKVRCLQFSLCFASVAQLTHESLGDHRSQR